MPRYVDMSGWDSFMNEMLDSRNMYDPYDNGYTDAMDRVDYWIEAQPTIDPESLRPHGRWVKSLVVRTDISALYDYICSECAIISDRESGYCPNCGARLALEEEDDA